jgi:ADP-heptose:LPS heptosyltransferase
VSDFQKRQLLAHGIKPIDRFIPLTLSQKSRNFIDFFIHPGSGSLTKNWSPKYFSQIILAFSHLRLALIIGPADEIPALEVKKYLKKEEPALAQRLIFFQKKPLLEMAYFLSSASVYVGNDSGISHLAAALGIPSFIIFGPTDAKIWKPWGKEVTMFLPSISCAPCDEEKRRVCKRKKCLESIKPEEVIERLRKRTKYDKFSYPG